MRAKEVRKRMLSLFVATSMLFSSVQITAFAQDADWENSMDAQGKEAEEKNDSENLAFEEELESNQFGEGHEQEGVTSEDETLEVINEESVIVTQPETDTTENLALLYVEENVEEVLENTGVLEEVGLWDFKNAFDSKQANEALKEEFAATPTGLATGMWKYVSQTTTTNATSLYSYELDEGTYEVQYKVKTGTWSFTWTTQGTIEVKFYREISFENLSSQGGFVVENGTTSSTVKNVYGNSTYAFTIENLEGYTPVVTVNGTELKANNGVYILDATTDDQVVQLEYLQDVAIVMVEQDETISSIQIGEHLPTDGKITIPKGAGFEVQVAPSASDALGYYAVESITVTHGDGTVQKYSGEEITYRDTVASITVASCASKVKSCDCDTYTVTAETKEVGFALNELPEDATAYAVKYNQAMVDALPEKVEQLILDRILNSEESYPSEELLQNYELQYLAGTSILGNTEYWKKIDESLSMIDGLFLHEFGESETETVRLVYNGNKQYPSIVSETVQIQQVEPRVETILTLHDGVEVAYDEPEKEQVDQELYAQLIKSLTTAEGTAISYTQEDFEFEYTLQTGNQEVTVTYLGDAYNYHQTSATQMVRLKGERIDTKLSLNKDVEITLIPNDKDQMDAYLYEHLIDTLETVEGETVSHVREDFIFEYDCKVGQQKVTVTYLGTQDEYQSAKATQKITILDPRVETQLTLQEGIEVVYEKDGKSEADKLLYNDLIISLTTEDGEEVEHTFEDFTFTYDYAAGEQEVTVVYNGTEYEYFATEAVTTIQISKAEVTVTVPSQSIQYGDAYEILTTTSPAGVDTFQLIVGLDRNLEGIVSVILSDSIRDTLQAVNIFGWTPYTQLVKLVNQTESIEEFIKLLSQDELLSLLKKYLGDEQLVVLETFQQIIEVVNSIPEVNERIVIRLEEYPTNAGVYLIGAVTADSNYETAIGVGYLTISPTKSEYTLQFAMELPRENGILTFEEAKEFEFGGYGVNAEGGQDVTNVYTRYTGVNSEGEFIYSNEPVRTPGVYAELLYYYAGNQYASPVMRAYVVSRQPVSVQFVEKNKVVDYDGEAHELEAFVYVDGECVEEAEILYTGIDVNNSTYISKNAPTDSGIYLATAYFKGNALLQPSAEIKGKLWIQPAKVTVLPVVTDSIYNGEEATVSYQIQETQGQVSTDPAKYGLELETYYREIVEGSLQQEGLPVHAGTYEISCKVISKSKNYIVTTETAQLTIAKKELTIVPDQNQGKYVDEKDPMTYAHKITGLVGQDEVVYTLSREDGEEAGRYNYILEVDQNREENRDYTFQLTGGTYQIWKYQTTIRFDNSVTTKTYDGQAFEVTAGVYVGSEKVAQANVSYSSGTAPVEVGTYEATASFEGDRKYDSATDVSVSLSITENPDKGEPENPGTPDEGEPENPGNPDEGEGENPGNPDEGEGENPGNPDEGDGENPGNPDEENPDPSENFPTVEGGFIVGPIQDETVDFAAQMDAYTGNSIDLRVLAELLGHQELLDLINYPTRVSYTMLFQMDIKPSTATRGEDGLYEVTIRDEKIEQGMMLVVLHYLGDGEYELLAPTLIEDGVMVFKANSFSPVAVPQIIVEKLSDTEEGSNESPAESNEVPGGIPTGDETNVTEVVIFAALCGLAMLTMIVCQRKRKRA